MADLVCDMDCIHKSKRPLRKWRNKDGSECYGCSLKHVAIDRISDPDGEVGNAVGEESMACCTCYEPRAQERKE